MALALVSYRRSPSFTGLDASFSRLSRERAEYQIRIRILQSHRTLRSPASEGALHNEELTFREHPTPETTTSILGPSLTHRNDSRSIKLSTAITDPNSSNNSAPSPGLVRDREKPRKQTMCHKTLKTIALSAHWRNILK